MEKEEQQLIDSFVENSVSLQKAITDATVSMARLTKEIEELIMLFREAAKTVEPSKDSEIIARLDALADENKTIARSLTSVIERPSPRPLPEFKFQ